MTEHKYKAHFQLLAEKHKLILHSDVSKAFFYIESVDELNEFDKALNVMQKDTCMLITASSGKFSDAESENHFDEQTAEIYILSRKKTTNNIIDLYNECKVILKDVIVRTKRDFRQNHEVKFTISDIRYEKVGPMNDMWYGYVASLTFICPFGYTLNSGTWTDK